MFVLFDGHGFACEDPINGPIGNILLENARVFDSERDAVQWALKNKFTIGVDGRAPKKGESLWTPQPLSKFTRGGK